MPEEKKNTMTTDAGRPVGDNQNSLTVGPRGPVVFEDFLLFEKMAHFNRERIPERVVHAQGSGARGRFVCTNPDMSKWTTAKLFEEVGKTTPLFIRFSTVGGEKGSADSERDPRGFAVKFYTEEGNWDMVGNNNCPTGALSLGRVRDKVAPRGIHRHMRNGAGTTNRSD